jgi:Flp pilus assembly protein TadB
MHLVVHLLLALLAAAAVAAAVSVPNAEHVALPLSGWGRRFPRLPRRRALAAVLARTWRPLYRVLVLEGRGPAGAGLFAEHAPLVRGEGLRVRHLFEDVEHLRWRLLHAGLGETRSVNWLRRQQLGAGTVLALVCGVVTWRLALPPLVLLVAVPLSYLTGAFVVLAWLARLAAARRDRLRVELVGILYALAAFAVAGRPVDRALDRIAERPGELAREIRMARLSHFRTGVPMDVALRILVARCDTLEVEVAMGIIIAARGGEIARLHRVLVDLAEETRRQIGEARKVRLAYAVIRSTALGTFLSLPILGITLLFPVLGGMLHLGH